MGISRKRGGKTEIFPRFKVQMLVFQVFILFLIGIHNAYAQKRFRVLSFNTWQMGNHVDDGLKKLAKHILALEPDIVSLQEVQNETCARELADLMPEGWSIVYPKKPYPDVALLTKHTIIPDSVFNTTAGVHASIRFSQGFQVNFWAFHGWWRAYGPYAAFNRLVTNISQIIAGEHAPSKKKTGRAGNIREMLDSKSMKKDLKELLKSPIIIAGDFNSPSHLDWIEENKDLHGGWVIPWPCTKFLADEGFADAYRELYPDPIKDPGLTWSTMCKQNVEWEYAFDEPQDRVDFIFYRGFVKPIRSELYSGTEPIKLMPHQKSNDYPSDHHALYTDFQFIE